MSSCMCCRLEPPALVLDAAAFRGLLCACGNADDPEFEGEALRAAVRKAQRGDRGEFERIIKAHLSFISREISKLVPRDALEDVAQEVCTRIFRALPRYAERGSFRWWVKRIIGRACLDYWRVERRQERSTRACAAAPLAEDRGVREPAREVLADLERFLAVLSPADRLVFVLVFLDDRPQRDAAHQLGLSLAALKVRCFRLRRRAKEWFAYE